MSYTEPARTAPRRIRIRKTRVAGLLIVVAAMIGAGCGANAPSETGTAGGSGSTGSKNTARGKAMRFSACMRGNGVSGFPDPEASGELTIDAVANGASIDTSTAAFEQAIGACRDLEPPGFTGHRRTTQEQRRALEFARCMREHGVPDFPDPTRSGALIDTNRIPSAAGRGARDIPGFQQAQDECHDVLAEALGRQP